MEFIQALRQLINETLTEQQLRVVEPVALTSTDGHSTDTFAAGDTLMFVRDSGRGHLVVFTPSTQTKYWINQLIAKKALSGLGSAQASVPKKKSAADIRGRRAY